MSLEKALKLLIEAGLSSSPTPWIELTAERIEKDGPYADFSGWESWMDDQMQRECSGDCREGHSCLWCELAEWWEETDILIRPQLYATMYSACEFAAIKTCDGDTTDGD